MTIRRSHLLAGAFALAAASCATAQTTAPAAPLPSAQPSLPVPSQAAPQTNIALAATTPAPLFDFKDSDIKFSLAAFMSILRDHRHEGWVLAAYPDPHTSRPLIGAGFSLDVPATPHAQTDPLNPHPFLEPSSAQLWQAAGLDPARLDRILEQFNRDLQNWTKKRYRRRIRTHTLTPQITDDEAIGLLRISAIQAIYNARGYCRGFDQLTGPQQMALSQLVYQMGTNLEEFTQFLAALNNDPIPAPTPSPVPADASASLVPASMTTPAALTPPASSSAVPATVLPGGDNHWSYVQQTLMQSQWAHKYSIRAASVIAMFDPGYTTDPTTAEQRISTVLRPPRATRHRASRSRASLRLAKYTRHAGPASRKHAARARRRRKVT